MSSQRVNEGVVGTVSMAVEGDGMASTALAGGPREGALYVKSLEKGLRVLYAFRQGGTSLGLGEIAERTGLHPSAAQRFIHTLCRLGYLSRDARTRRYSVAPKLLDFSFIYLCADRLAEVATPHMIDLGKQCDEAVNLSQLDGAEIISIVRMPRRGVRTAAVVGSRRPAFCTSAGRVLLADLPNERTREIIATSERSPLTPTTHTEVDTIMRHIEAARSDGFAIVDEEFVIGEISVAAAIFDDSGAATAALNIPVPTARWSVDDARARLAPAVVLAARAISRANGSPDAFD